MTQVLLLEPLIPLFWTSGDIYPVFQSQGGSPTCMFPCLHTIDSSHSPLVLNLLTVQRSAWQLSLFDPDTCRSCVHKHWWRFKPITVCTATQGCKPLATSAWLLLSLVVNNPAFFVPRNERVSLTLTLVNIKIMFSGYLCRNNAQLAHVQKQPRDGRVRTRTI